tara:strand:+ start:480 stop:1424 length:945 start_codon:yes stop_codon:yes gene_type:complete
LAIFLDHQSVRLENGLSGSPVRIATGNPLNFYQAISEPQSIENVKIWAQLFQPSAEKSSLVIVVPGSLGLSESHFFKAKLLTDAGIAVCLIDPFGERGVESTIGNQAQYSFAASAIDILCAVDFLSTLKGVDPDRIGIQGHSRGGSAAILAATMQKFTNYTKPIAGVYAAYPWCGLQFSDPSVGETKIRSIIGDQDEWCSVQQVQGFTQALKLSGAESSIKIVAGAHHGFDRFSPVEVASEASVARGAPTIYIKENGVYMHPILGETGGETNERDLMLYAIKAGYGNQGARIGSSEGLADVFHQDMMEFWEFLV